MWTPAWGADELRKRHPQPGIETVAVSTTGDRIAVSWARGLVLSHGHTFRELAKSVGRRKRLAFGGGGRFLLADEYVLDGHSLETVGFGPSNFERNYELAWPHAVLDAEGSGLVLVDDGGSTDSGLTGRGPPLREPTITLYSADIRSVRRRRTLPMAYEQSVGAVTFDRAGRRFVFATKRGDVVAWSSDGAVETPITKLHGGNVDAMHAVEGGTLVMFWQDVPGRGYANAPRTLCWWKGLFEGAPTEIGLEVALTMEELKRAVPSPDGRFLAVPRARTPEQSPRESIEIFELRVDGLPRTAESEALRELDREVARLETSIAYAKRTLSEQSTFARAWGADVNDTTDRREELSDLRADSEAALVKAEAARALARAPWTAAAQTPTSARPLVKAILADRDSDEPRLALAAALGDEHPRAQLIRVQCEWERARPARRRMLEARAARLLEDYGAEWEKVLAPITERRAFRRGFIDAIEANPDKFMFHGELAVREEEPVRELRCTGPLQGLPYWHGLERITSLACSDNPTGLVGSGNIGHLRSLRVSDPPRGIPDWLTRGMDADAFRSLEELVIQEGDPLGANLGRVATLPKLRSLGLGGSSAMDHALAYVMETELRTRLRSFDLTNVTDSDALRVLHQKEMEFPELERLRLYKVSSPGSGDVFLLAPKLAELRLVDCVLDVESAEILAEQRFPLRSLSVDGKTGEGFPKLAAAPWLAGISEVSFGYGMPPETITPILERLGPSLASLSFCSDDLAPFAHALLKSSALEGLELVSNFGRIDAAFVDAVVPRAKKLAVIEFRPDGAGDVPPADVAARLRAHGFEPAPRDLRLWFRAALSGNDVSP